MLALQRFQKYTQYFSCTKLIKSLMKLFIGSLSFKAQDEDLMNLFKEYGDVMSAKVVVDKFSGRSRGFGFVEMSEEADAKKAIEALNGYSLLGKEIVVNEAIPRTDRPSRPQGNGGGFNRKPFKRY